MATIRNPVTPKDFVETHDGLVFAVVADGLENNKVRCYLRYVRHSQRWQKQSSTEAHVLLENHYPQYLFHSHELDAHLHAVPVTHIKHHYQPRQRLQDVLQQSTPDLVEQDLVLLLRLWQGHGLDLTQLGVTGSILIGAQNPESDLDVVCYNPIIFQQCRSATRDLIQSELVQHLHEADWQSSYQRRNCWLSYEEYVWHEKRKFNKALINGRKFDLTLVDVDRVSGPQHYHKHGAITLQCRVVDDRYGFDYPAEFLIEHERITSVVSFTATYTGQAQADELIEVSGMLEESEQGEFRIVVGADREAHGEYIKVIRA